MLHEMVDKTCLTVDKAFWQTREINDRSPARMYYCIKFATVIWVRGQVRLSSIPSIPEHGG